jgi:hypothetical protein
VRLGVVSIWRNYSYHEHTYPFFINAFFFYLWRCIKENTSASSLWFPTKSGLSIAFHHISRRRSGRHIVYGAGGI